jgi:hypothetical protein
MTRQAQRSGTREMTRGERDQRGDDEAGETMRGEGAEGADRRYDEVSWGTDKTTRFEFAGDRETTRGDQEQRG